MIYENNGQKYLLLTPQCQIEKNRQDIEAIINDAVAFNYIGMKVVGQVNTADELPKKADYEVWPFDYGDAFAVGTKEPYNYYLWTRAFGAYLSDHWFNIGVFPGPSTVPGPKGETGDTGPAPNLTIGTVTSTLSQPQVTIEGTSPNYTLNFKLQKGDKGEPGTNGRDGVDGKNGKDGTNAVIYTVKGAVDTVSQLPVATSVSTDTAYLVKDGNLLYGIIVQNGTNIWYNYGSTSVGPRGPAGVGTTDLTHVQFPEGERTITFDDTDGLSVSGTGKFSYGTNDTATPQMTVSVPIKAGAGIAMDADANGKFLEIKNTDHDAVANKVDKIVNHNPDGTENNALGLYRVGSASRATYPAHNPQPGVIPLWGGNSNLMGKALPANYDKKTDEYKWTLVNNETFDNALSGKLDKKIASLGKIKLYGVNGSTQNMYSAVAGSPDASTVAMRGADGAAVFEQGTSLKSAVILDTIEPVVIIPNTPKDSSGTITEEQLNRLLQDSLSSVNTKPGIFLNNQYYEPMDREYEIEVLGYTHAGYEGNQFVVKNITININAMTWTLNTTNIAGSGRANVRINGSATEGSLSEDDWNKLRNMSVLAIHYGSKVYYLGYNDFANSMRYYPHKPDAGFSEEYILVPHSAPRWAFTQTV